MSPSYSAKGSPVYHQPSTMSNSSPRRARSGWRGNGNLKISRLVGSRQTSCTFTLDANSWAGRASGNRTLAVASWRLTTFGRGTLGRVLRLILRRDSLATCCVASRARVQLTKPRSVTIAVTAVQARALITEHRDPHQTPYSRPPLDIPHTVHTITSPRETSAMSSGRLSARAPPHLRRRGRSRRSGP